MSGLEAFDRIRQIDPHLPVLFITAYSTTDTAIEAMKRGAFEYLIKPVDLQAAPLGGLPKATPYGGG
jgi:two-component system nitrogen regulation response regulator GlnG